jgi:hypothetical protein
MKTSLRNIIIIMLVQAFYPVSAQTYRILVTPEKSNSAVYIDLSGQVVLDPDSKICFDYSKEGTAFTLNKNVNLFDVSGNRIIPEFDFQYMLRSGREKYQYIAVVSSRQSIKVNLAD